MIDWLISSPLGGLFQDLLWQSDYFTLLMLAQGAPALTTLARMSQEEVGLGSGARRSGAAKRRPELAHSTNKTLFLGGLQKD